VTAAVVLKNVNCDVLCQLELKLINENFLKMKGSGRRGVGKGGGVGG